MCTAKYENEKLRNEEKLNPEASVLQPRIFSWLFNLSCYLSINAGRIHSVRMDNSTFERVEECKYLGTTLTNQNSIAEEIKSRLRSGNACCYSAQNPLSSRLLSKNLKIKIYRTIILPIVLYGCET